jgi:hypothetical protein
LYADSQDMLVLSSTFHPTITTAVQMAAAVPEIIDGNRHSEAANSYICSLNTGSAHAHQYFSITHCDKMIQRWQAE